MWFRLIRKGNKFVERDGTSASNSYDMSENFFKTLESSGGLSEFGFDKE